MEEIIIQARLTSETLKEAWWSCVNALLRLAFFVCIVIKPLAHYFEQIARVGVRQYPWRLEDLTIPFVAIVVLYPIIPLVLSLRSSVRSQHDQLVIQTPFRKVLIPLASIREDLWLTKHRLFTRRSLFPMKNWYLVVPLLEVKHTTNDPAYSIGPFWRLSELKETIEKINRIR